MGMGGARGIQRTRGGHHREHARGGVINKSCHRSRIADHDCRLRRSSAVILTALCLPDVRALVSMHSRPSTRKSLWEARTLLAAWRSIAAASLTNRTRTAGTTCSPFVATTQTLQMPLRSKYITLT